MAKETFKIQSYDVQPVTGTDLQEVTLVLRISNEVDLDEQFEEGNELAIELPSHAPPPQE